MKWSKKKERLLSGFAAGVGSHLAIPSAAYKCRAHDVLEKRSSEKFIGLTRLGLLCHMQPAPAKLCCERYDRMPSLLLGTGKLCDAEDCILSKLTDGGVIYNPHYCRDHRRYFCESCFCAAKDHTQGRSAATNS